MEVHELRDVMEQRFDKLDDKVDKTNGNVQELQLWKAWVTGAMKMLVAVAALPSMVLVVAMLLDRYSG